MSRRTHERDMENTRVAYYQDAGKLRRAGGAEERRAVLSADPGLFWELAGPYKQKLYHFIHKSLFFSEEADDVFQDTLLRALRYFASYRADKNFGTWLFAIAHNEIRRHWRHSRRNDPLVLAEQLAVRHERARLDLVREVYAFAEGLKPKPREVFFLFYDSGFSIEEISRITGMRTGNIKFILNRARKTLRERIGGHDGKP